jgi:hypothetical protein
VKSKGEISFATGFTGDTGVDARAIAGKLSPLWEGTNSCLKKTLTIL